MAINSVVGVRISYLYKNNQYEEIKDRVKFSFNYLAFMGFACVFGLWAVAKLFIPLFYGPGYEKSVVVLILFAPILLFTSISSCLNAQFFVPVGRRAECTRYIISYLFWKNSDDIIDFKSLFNVSWKKASSGIIMLLSIIGFNFIVSSNSVIILVVDIVLGAVVYVFSLLFLFKDEWSTNIALSFVVTIKDKLKK